MYRKVIVGFKKGNAHPNIRQSESFPRISDSHSILNTEHGLDAVACIRRYTAGQQFP
jgi:hypothetical protein